MQQVEINIALFNLFFEIIMMSNIRYGVITQLFSLFHTFNSSHNKLKRRTSKHDIQRFKLS